MEKYLIASSGDILDSKVSARFGYLNYFLIINPQNMKFGVFAGIHDDEPAQGIKRLIGQNIKKVIVGNIGHSSFYEITSLGCTLYLCRNIKVSEAIRQVMNGNVQSMNEPKLPNSIHSARNTHYPENKTRKVREQRRGMGGGRVRRG